MFMSYEKVDNTRYIQMQVLSNGSNLVGLYFEHVVDFEEMTNANHEISEEEAGFMTYLT